MDYAPNNRLPGSRTRPLIVAAVAVASLVALALALALAYASDDGNSRTVAGQAQAQQGSQSLEASSSAGTPERVGLKLEPGVYRFTSAELGTEATDETGRVLQEAGLASRSWEFVLRPDGSWVERSVDSGQPIERRFENGEHRTKIGDQSEEVTVPDAAMERDARAADSSIPAGGPRVEFNPYGASFLVEREMAQNDLASADGNEASVTYGNAPCGDVSCVRVDFERQVPTPPDDSEYMRSLPWRENNIEHTTLIYESQSQIVHLYETSLNDFTLHRFELTQRP